MASSQPFLRPSSVGHGCFLCGIDVIKRGGLKFKKEVPYKKNLDTIKDHANKWKCLNIPTTDTFVCYTEASARLTDKKEGYFHENCLLNIRTKHKAYQSKYGERNDKNQPSIDSAMASSTSMPPNACTRSSVPCREEKEVCFVCNQVTEERVSRISTDAVVAKTKSAALHHIKKPNCLYYSAAKRLDIMLGGTNEVFAVDVFYHNLCLQNYIKAHKEDNDTDPTKTFVRQLFYSNITLKICNQKNAYLLKELWKDSNDWSDEYNVEKVFSGTKSLRRDLENQFDNLGFYKLGRDVVVYSKDIDPIMYSESTLHGFGLRTNDIIRSFAKMIHRVADCYAEGDHIEWPATLAQLIAGYEHDKPIAELYNAIYMTANRQWKSSIPLNDHGFAKVQSKNIATKIWSIASDWTALITGLRNSKQITLAMDIARLTANKEVGSLLWKAGHIISPNDIRLQNDEFLASVNDFEGNLAGMVKNTVTHTSLDNNDKCQDTSTGKNTTHHTNFLLFQPNPPTNGVAIQSSCTNRSTTASETNLKYKIGKLVSPQTLPNYQDDDSQELVERSFQEDLLWSLVGGLPSTADDPLPLLGSWTSYKRKTCSDVNIKSLVNYLPANENPPEHGVCKEYLEFCIEVMGCLDIKRLFVHADEQVYARIVQLIWKHKEQFKNIIPLMGGFHQLRVFQKVLYKRHAVVGYGDWYWDSGVIAEGSASAAMEGRHYYRSMRVHKEGFDALAQYRFEELTYNYKNINGNLQAQLKELRKNPSNLLVDEIISSQQFQQLYSAFIAVEGDRPCMSMKYMKDVSLMLCIVSAVREGQIDRHIQAERQFLKLIYGFDQINYKRYNAFQHVFLTNMKREGDDAYSDLVTHGFGCTTSNNGRFNAKHGDLQCEHFNRETKGTAGPFRSGYSTNVDAVNRWIKTSHCHAELRQAVKKQFRICTSSVHKELTPKNMQMHQEHVQLLKAKLQDYNAQPFSTGPVRNLVTGKEVDAKIVKGLLTASEIGDKQYKQFLKDVFINGTKTIFESITKNNIDTGVKKKKTECKIIDVLKEDKNAFGLIISKCKTKEEGFSFPLTYYPLSIAKSEQLLYSSDKAKFRNELMSDCSVSQAESNAVWIVDLGYGLRQIGPKNTYKEFSSALLDWILPNPHYLPRSIVITVDDYRKESTKDGERKSRRGGKEEGKRVHVSGLDQMMPKGKIKWADFLTNGQNKNELIQIFGKYLKSEDARSKIKGLKITFSGRESIWSVMNGVVEEKGLTNHEEADTKVPLFAAESNSNVVAVAQDCVILILLIAAYNSANPKFEWQFNYELNRFVSVNKICQTLGGTVCQNIIQYHALSGCDTTSYFYGLGKIVPFKRAVERNHLSMISELGASAEISNECIDKCKEFIRTTLYPGKVKENYLQTRIRLYDRQNPKTKTTMTIPPDEDSCTQHIRRSNLAAFNWRNYNKQIIPPINKYASGWKLSCDGLVVPIWYVGPQVPASCKQKTPKRQLLAKNNGYEADNEDNTKILRTNNKKSHENVKTSQKQTQNSVKQNEEKYEEEKKQQMKEKARTFRKNRKQLTSSDDVTSAIIDSTTTEKYFEEDAFNKMEIDIQERYSNFSLSSESLTSDEEEEADDEGKTEGMPETRKKSNVPRKRGASNEQKQNDKRRKLDTSDDDSVAYAPESTDDWERDSEFDNTSDSSGSDWM